MVSFRLRWNGGSIVLFCVRWDDGRFLGTLSVCVCVVFELRC